MEAIMISIGVCFCNFRQENPVTVPNNLLVCKFRFFNTNDETQMIDATLQVRARRLREHEVVRDVFVDPIINHIWVRACSRRRQANLVAVITQDTPPPVIPFPLVFSSHKLIGLGWLHAQ